METEPLMPNRPLCTDTVDSNCKSTSSAEWLFYVR